MSRFPGDKQLQFCALFVRWEMAGTIPLLPVSGNEKAAILYIKMICKHPQNVSNISKKSTKSCSLTFS